MTITTGTVQHIDPTTLVIEANVRTSAPITKDFIASIRENGVITPILARRDEHGTVIVRAGQRRTLAAREAGVATIPVYVVEGDETTADRIVQQIIENDQRTELTVADRTAAWAQLAFEGVTAAAIAKRTGTKTDAVKKGLAVAESKTVTSALHEHELTLDQAAVLLEFEDDADARATLIEVATHDPAQFEHTAQTLRDEAAHQALLTAAEQEHTANGFQVLTRSDAYSEGSPWVALYKLRTEDGKQVTAEHVAAVPTRGVLIDTNWRGEVTATYLVQDPTTAGLIYAHGGAPTAPLTEEQIEEERVEKSTERKTLIANNKAWGAAETVRREWIATFLSRKTLPKDAEQVIALGLTRHRFAVSSGMSNGSELAHTLLGIERPSGYHADALAALVEANPAKARLVALAVVLGGQEANTSKESWRRGDERTAAHFRQLAAWGYALSPVEQIVTGNTTPADAAGLN
ncbi:ParB/RepB/Spo0J family partition protein [Rathayibacter rathayi]|uniref:ParB/RepB/Spo0J family partition protein n=1 Tax=Rathayibacter rathayi TaxID=33887 RepID=UPI000CE85A8A|nr:ParB/RepB/Spo0J family partition protein [Rathayibacter rathayi]PPF18077.1 chromosome partitioning protein [Rathayibacter rathayi]PPG87545.1 chromosome partitioning protein [Rathayibacter rathayi]PPG95117.1 chromosome partitioning protein [Rathayibacter rathayi]